MSSGAGSRPSRVERVGDTARRPVEPGGVRVHELLVALEDIGFAYSPRFLGIDGKGREVLSWIEGESGPAGWSKVVPEDGLRRFAQLLREVHTATADLRLPPEGWSGGRGAPQADGVITHGDFGPWNVVWDGPEPVGIIDWDFAGPAPAADDVAYALEYVTPFRDDDEAVRWLRYPGAPDRRRRAAIFCAAYGVDLDDVPSAVAERQEQDIERVLGLAATGIEPQATWVADGVEAELRRRVAWTRTAGASAFAPT
jgi:hypothetical protein